MATTRVSMAGQVGRKLVGLIVSVIALTIIRSVLGTLPVLRNAAPIGESGITALMIQQAVLDTLILAALLRFGFHLSAILRAGSTVFPESGPLWNLIIITLVVAAAQNAYSGLAGALLRENAQIYGWVFLVLTLLPLSCAVVLAAWKVDALTEAFFRAARAGARKCPFCGARISNTARFCEQCGRAVVTAAPGA